MAHTRTHIHTSNDRRIYLLFFKESAQQSKRKRMGVRGTPFAHQNTSNAISTTPYLCPTRLNGHTCFSSMSFKCDPLTIQLSQETSAPVLPYPRSPTSSERRAPLPGRTPAAVLPSNQKKKDECPPPGRHVFLSPPLDCTCPNRIRDPTVTKPCIGTLNALFFVPWFLPANAPPPPPSASAYSVGCG